MSTRINLEFPYSEKWKVGYLNINSEKRRTLVLYNNNKDRSSTQYARYLMAVKLGRFLEENEQVDHIDEDKTNDDLLNLQILTPLANARKTHSKPPIIATCPVCRKVFETDKRKLGGKTPSTKCCSNRCGGVYSHIKEF